MNKIFVTFDRLLLRSMVLPPSSGAGLILRVTLAFCNFHQLSLHAFSCGPSWPSWTCTHLDLMCDGHRTIAGSCPSLLFAGLRASLCTILCACLGSGSRMVARCITPVVTSPGTQSCTGPCARACTWPCTCTSDRGGGLGMRRLKTILCIWQVRLSAGLKTSP